MADTERPASAATTLSVASMRQHLDVPTISLPRPELPRLETTYPELTAEDRAELKATKASTHADRLKLLTREWRTHFEEVGEDLVRADLLRGAYGETKRLAAVAWLKFERDAARRRQRSDHRVLILTLWAAVGT